MRQALRGLTTRGRAFVAAGITASCALLLGQKDLLRVGILVALPVVAALVVGRTRLRLQVAQPDTLDQVPVGSRRRWSLPWSNQGRMPAGAAARGPYSHVLGHRPRFVVDLVSLNWRRTVSYPASSDVRGLFQVGPLMLTVADLFGLVETSWTFTRSQHLLVAGSTGCLEIRLGADRACFVENRPRAIASATRRTRRSASTATATTCAGGTGARPRDELMVRREEQPWQSRCAMFHHGPPRTTATALIQLRVGRQCGRLDRHGPDPPRLRDHPAGRADHAVGDQPPDVGRRASTAHPTAVADRGATVEEHKYAEISPC